VCFTTVFFLAHAAKYLCLAPAYDQASLFLGLSRISEHSASSKVCKYVVNIK
jgi:hypothetical protein